MNIATAVALTVGAALVGVSVAAITWRLTPNDWPARSQEPEPLPVVEPCPDGFRWMGQPLTTCEKCGLPAWEHDGWADNAEDNPFSARLVLRPWKPGERERIEARWKK